MMWNVFYRIGIGRLNAGWVFVLDAFLIRLFHFAFQMFPAHFTNARSSLKLQFSSDPRIQNTCMMLPGDHNEVYLTYSATVVSLLATGVVVQ